jgi:hypothetical protein
MRFKNVELPSEYPFAVIVEDAEHARAYMYVIMREKIYRFDPVVLMSLFHKYAEGVVDNDPDNAPSLEKIRNAVQALRGITDKN